MDISNRQIRSVLQLVSKNIQHSDPTGSHKILEDDNLQMHGY